MRKKRTGELSEAEILAEAILLNLKGAVRSGQRGFEKGTEIFDEALKVPSGGLFPEGPVSADRRRMQVPADFEMGFDGEAVLVRRDISGGRNGYPHFYEDFKTSGETGRERHIAETEFLNSVTEHERFRSVYETGLFEKKELPERMSELFCRDARRYDGPFERY